MTNERIGPIPEEIYPPEIIESVERFISEHDPETSSDQFVREVGNIKVETRSSNPRLRLFELSIARQSANKGFGILSYAAEHDRDGELLATAQVVHAFRDRKLATQPLVVPVDEFYRLIPGNSSLVGKVIAFDKIARIRHLQQNFAIVLSCFSESKIFTRDILTQVPSQRNAGLELDQSTDFSKALRRFVNQNLPALVEQHHGDMQSVLAAIAKGRDEQDSRLLLAVSLLLQDGQGWQDLWYERKSKGTPLCIVGPSNFHNAMRRLNMHLGHGNDDYIYRASRSLGAYDMEADSLVEVPSMEAEGLSADEFRQRIETFLRA